MPNFVYELKNYGLDNDSLTAWRNHYFTMPTAIIGVRANFEEGYKTVISP